METFQVVMNWKLPVKLVLFVMTIWENQPNYIANIFFAKNVWPLGLTARRHVLCAELRYFVIFLKREYGLRFYESIFSIFFPKFSFFNFLSRFSFPNFQFFFCPDFQFFLIFIFPPIFILFPNLNVSLNFTFFLIFDFPLIFNFS